MADWRSGPQKRPPAIPGEFTQERRLIVKYDGAPQETEVMATPLDVTQDLEQRGVTFPRPDLAGLRLTLLSGGPMYRINSEGYLQLHP
jgi:hypothetical protein